MKEQIDQIITECLKTTQSDLKFAVEEPTKELVLLTCSEQYRLCTMNRLREKAQENTSMNPNGMMRMDIAKMTELETRFGQSVVSEFRLNLKPKT